MKKNYNFEHSSYLYNSQNGSKNSFFPNSNSDTSQKQSIKNKINLNGKQESLQLPVDQYPINHEPFTEITKKPHDTLKYIQQISLRYLQPPEADKPGDLIIRQLPDTFIDPAPPIVIRQIPSRPKTPPPLFIREPPPTPLPKIEKQIIEIPGKIQPPPPRQVIVEKLPPIPPKPQTIIIDKWLPQKQQKRKVIYEKIFNKVPSNQNQKNILINWESPKVEIQRIITNLGVYQVDPKEYTEMYRNSFSKTEEIEKILKSIEAPNYQNSKMTRSLRSSYKNNGFDFNSVNRFSQIENKKRVSFQLLS